MNVLQHFYKALPTLVGRCCAVLLLLVSGIAASQAQPISFSNATVTAVSTTHNFQCCTDAAGISCGFLPNRPEPRWRVRARPNVTSSAWTGVTVLNPGNGVSCGTFNWSSVIGTYSNQCMPSILVEVQSWEEDGCGADDVYGTGCANNDENENTTIFTINHQTGAQNTNVNYAFTQSNGYDISFTVNWAATTGGLSAPTALSPTICAGNTALLTATNTAAAGNHFEWFSDATLTTLLASGTSYTTPSLAANATYYVTEVTAGNCHGPVTTVNVTVNPAPTASITGTSTICQNASTTLTASGGGTYAWNTLQTGAGITVSPASSTAYTVTVTAANGCTASSAIAITVNPAPTTTPYTLCQNGTVMGGLTSDLAGSQALQSTFTGNTATGSTGTMLRPQGFAQGGSCTNSGVGTATPYTAQTFTVPATGSFTFETCSSSPTWDSYIIIYQAPFDPATGCASNTVITANDDFCLPLSSATATLTAGVSYVVVVTGFGNTDAGAYTLTASSPVLVGSVPSVEWYTAASGGAPIATGSPFNPVGVAGSGIANTNTAAATTFYAQYPGGVCRTPAIFTINPTPNTPTAANVTVCYNSNAALSATSNIGTIEWYNVSSGGAPVSTGGSFNIPNATANATYWAEAVQGTCRSARTQVDITVTPTPLAPMTANTSTCAGSTATLNATGTTLTWWNAAIGGTQVGTGSTFTTAALNSTTDFFAQQTVASCPSPRSLATVVVNPIPAAPIANGITICNNTNTTLSASGSNIEWYSAATGGTLLGTGNSFITPNLTATTAYYPQQTLLSCASPRTTVTVTVNPIPATPLASAAAICTGSNGIFTATGTGTIQWYDMAVAGTLQGTGGTYNAGVLLNPTTIYVQQSETTSGTTCVSARVPVSIVVNAIPAAPTTTGANVCENTSATVSATGSAIAWFDAGGSPLGTGNSLIINPLSATTTVYAEQTVSGCTSTRTATLATAKPVPAAPTVTSQMICLGASSTLVASPDMSGTVNWYTVPMGWNANTGTVFTQTPVAAGTYTYSVNETLNGCVSQNTTSTLTVNPLPNAPLIAGTTLVCSNGSASLTATGAGIEWYDAMTGGNLLQVGNTYNTGALTANMTYYAQQTVAGCVSPRAAVTVTVNAVPSAPIAASVAVCEGSVTTLTATNGNAYTWFSDAVGLQQIGTSPSFTTPILNSTTIYYVQTTSGAGCVSDITPVTVTVNAMPSMPISTPALSVCSGNTATITVSGSGTVGNSIRVYDGAHVLLQGFAITNVINTFVFTTPVLTSNATYYFGEEQGFGVISCESPQASVIVNVEALPLAPTVPAATAICSGTSTSLSVTPAGNGIVRWYNAAGAVVATGNNFTTPALTATTTYTVKETSLTGCVGASATVTVTVNNLPNQPNVQPNNVNVCRGAAATINIQNPNAANTYSWFTDAAATQPANPATGSVYTSNALLNSTVIYVQTTNANGCKGPIRTVNITVTTVTAPTAITGTTVCDGSMATLIGTNTNNNTEWYNNPQGNGTPLFTGSPYTTAALTANTTVFAQNVNGQGCKSTTTPVNIVVTALPATPVTASATICNNQTTTLNATGAGTIMWYDATGTTLQGVGATFNTPALTATTTYAVVAEASGCKSASATATVTVNPTPANPAATTTPVCRGTAATLNVTAPVATSTYTWFADAVGVTQLATGTTFTTPNLNNTTTYYLRRTALGCSSALVAVTAQVLPQPPTPSAAPVNACVGATVDVNATNGNPTTEWYDAPTGGNLLFTGNPFAVNTSAASNITVFVSNVQGTCRSQSTPVNITVNALPAPAAVSGNLTVCSGQSTTLNAQGGGNIFWLDAPPSFAILQLGSNFTTPVLQANANFIVLVQDQNACQSIVPVNITVNQTPPDAQPTAASVCAGQAAVLTSASGPGTTWYADATGNTIVGTGTSVTTAPLQQTTTFYAAVVSPQGCRSNIKPITVVVNPLPSAPSAVNQTICEGTTATLTAINSIGIPRWYNNPNGMGSAQLGTSITTPILTTSATYYIANVQNGCNSLLNPVTVTVTPKPASPTLVLPVEPDYCIGATINGFVQGTGGVINWNVQAFGGAININQTGEAFNLNTANLPVVPGIYPLTITQIQNGCVSDPLNFNVELHGAPLLNPFAATTAVCEGAAINIASGMAGANLSYLWTLPNGTTQITPDLAIATANVNDHQGFYSLVVTDANFGCASQPQSVYQEVNATPTGIVIQTNSPLCAGTTLSLNTPLIGNASYAWTGPNGFASSTRNNTVPNVTANGTYDVVVTVDGCASVPASADVVVIAAPMANAGTDATIPYGAVTTLHAIGGFVYNWSPAMLLNNSSTQSPSTIATLPVGSTTYTVTVADANGCTATDAVTIIVTNEPVANSIMDLITPNGDGMNDEWHVPFLAQLDGYQLSIYARAGNLVYSTSNYDQKWAGTMDGANLPDGAYWFIIALKDGKVIKGAVTIKR